MLPLGLFLLIHTQQPSADELIRQIKAIPDPALTETTDEAIAKWEAGCDKVAEEQSVLIMKLYSNYPDHKETSKMLNMRWDGMTGRHKPCDISRLDRLDADLKSFLGKKQLPANKQVADFWVAKSTIWREWKTMLTAKVPVADAAAKPYVDKSLVAADGFNKLYPKDDSGPYLYYDFCSMAKGSEAEKVGLGRLINLYPEHRLGKSSKGRLKVLNTMGKPFDLSFTDALSGKKIDMKDYAGKVVLVDFWATWCNPCRLDIEKNMLSKYEEWKQQGVEVVGVSADVAEDQGGRKMLLDYVNEKKIPWPNFYSGKKIEDGPGSDWGISSYPTQFLIDKKGNLRYTSFGGKRDELIKKLLAE